MNPNAPLHLDSLFDLALQEDVGSGDITTQAIFKHHQRVEAQFLTRAPTVVCGVSLLPALLSRFDPSAEYMHVVPEGTLIEPNTVFARVHANAAALLTCERVLLNMLMRLCGVAYAAHQAVQAVPPNCHAKIFDTRKTMLGWRALDKWAVRVGGACNHRMGLYDAFLIKDNHIAAAGSISRAIAACRLANAQAPLEVEVDTLMQLHEALACQPDVIMLDNFTIPQLREAVSVVKGACILEASGGITLQTIPDVARTGVHRISLGELTHSVVAANLSLEFVA